MGAVQDILVPDIGDFKDVEIIEVNVSAGDQVEENDPLITLESDKATMEVPSPRSGKVVEIKVAVGDKVSEGSLVCTMEAAGGGDAPAPEPAAEKAPAEEKPPPRRKRLNRPPRRHPLLRPRPLQLLPRRRRPRRSTRRRSPRLTPARPCASSRANSAPTLAGSREPGPRGASSRKTCRHSSRACWQARLNKWRRPALRPAGLRWPIGPSWTSRRSARPRSRRSARSRNSPAPAFTATGSSSPTSPTRKTPTSPTSRRSARR